MPYKDPEKSRAASAIRQAAYRARNPEKTRAREIAYREANREKLQIAAATYRATHPGKSTADATTYRERNSEQIRARRLARYAANPEKERARSAAFRARNPESARASTAAWAAAHPEKQRARISKRRALKKNAFVENVDHDAVFVRDGGVCQICDQFIGEAKWHVDHRIPLSRGGEHSYANCQLAHAYCNQVKSDK